MVSLLSETKIIVLTQLLHNSMRNGGHNSHKLRYEVETLYRSNAPTIKSDYATGFGEPLIRKIWVHLNEKEKPQSICMVAMSSGVFRTTLYAITFIIMKIRQQE